MSTEFTDRDVVDLEEYSSLNIAALIGFLLGLLSPVAFAQIVLVFVPLLGIAVSSFGVWSTQRQGDRGKVLAVIGLLLSSICATAVIVKYAASQWIVRQHAARAADHWLDLVRAGRLHEAHQWSLSFSLRSPRSDLLDAYYEEHPPARRSERKLFERPGLRELGQMGEQAMWQRQSVRSLAINFREEAFLCEYTVTAAGEVTPLKLSARRRWNLDYLRYDWIIGPAEE